MINGVPASDGSKPAPTTRELSITTETSELTMKTLPNIHASDVLLEEFLIPMGIQQNSVRDNSLP